MHGTECSGPTVPIDASFRWSQPGGPPEDMHDDVRLLESFVALAEERSFRRAAQKLAIAQPPLTRRIRRLEQLVGAPLFIRARTGTTLTQVGVALLDQAQNAVSEVAKAFEVACLAASASEQRLSLIAPPDAYDGVLPPLLELYRRRHTSVRLDLHLHDGFETVTLTDLLAECSDLDIAIVRYAKDLQPLAPMLAKGLLVKESCCVFLPARHHLARRGPLELTELLTADIPPIPDRAHVEGIVGRTPVAPSSTPAEFGTPDSSADVTLGLVAAGFGWTVMPGCYGRHRRKGVAMVALRSAPTSSLWMVWRRRRARPAVCQFLDIAQRPHC
jgi:DNA-binding transcriptional LysR family regulator